MEVNNKISLKKRIAVELITFTYLTDKELLSDKNERY